MYLKTQYTEFFLNQEVSVGGWNRPKGYEQIGTRYVWTRRNPHCIGNVGEQRMNSAHSSQKIAVKYQLRIVFRYHDFLNVIVKEYEK